MKAIRHQITRTKREVRWDGVPPRRWRHITFSGECFP